MRSMTDSTGREKGKQREGAAEREECEERPNEERDSFDMKERK